MTEMKYQLGFWRVVFWTIIILTIAIAGAMVNTALTKLSILGMVIDLFSAVFVIICGTILAASAYHQVDIWLDLAIRHDNNEREEHRLKLQAELLFKRVGKSDEEIAELLQGLDDRAKEFARSRQSDKKT